jgi:hypothetical protein
MFSETLLNSFWMTALSDHTLAVLRNLFRLSAIATVACAKYGLGLGKLQPLK